MAELPSLGNAVQSSEMMRNSLGLNYKSAALDQLSDAGIYEGKSRKAKGQQLDIFRECLKRRIVARGDITKI
jgi:hypothetical protein